MCEEEGAAEGSCCGLTLILIPHPPALLRDGGRGVSDEGVELNLGRRGVGWEGRRFRFCFSPSNSFFTLQ